MGHRSALSASLYEAVFACAPIGNYLLSPTPEATILAVNDAFLNTATRKREDLVGVSLFVAFSGDPNDPGDTGVEALRASIARAIATGEPQSMSAQRYPIKITTPEGGERYEERFWNAVNTPVFDRNGKLLCVSHITIDVTKQIRAEADLRAKEIELGEAQRLAHLGSWYWDAKTDRILASEEMLRIFRRESIPPSRDQLGSLYPPESWAKLEAAYKKTLSTGIGYSLELQAYRGDGEPLWIEVRAEAAYDGRGNILGLRGTAQDITERKAAENEIRRLNVELDERVRRRTAELQRANDALVRSNIELQRFAHAAAHDLQTPLRSIVGFTQLLQREIKGCTDPQADEWMALVIENTRRLQILIQELLTYSRLEAGVQPFMRVDLQEMLEQVVAALKAPISEAGAEITWDRLPTVKADRVQMALLLQNLIENGIKYNRSRPPRVSVASERQGGEWIFSVADNGIGIDPKHQGRIFEIFRRLHSHQKIPGTGIGLAICQRIVERHGGRLWVESEPGKGSVFHFSLPAGPVRN